MAIHELSSNASKYGALSTAEGRLAVSWKCFTDAKGVKLNIVWLETGGPPVERPRRAGFGTTLIECTVGHDLDGEVTREFLSSGVRCTIEIPLTADVGYLLPTSQNGGKPREGP
jgi:two-component system CheB/CheR fusion protein